MNGETLRYDAENRLVSATDLPGLGYAVEQYFYDGLGRRVAKDGPSGTTVYLYDAFGRLVSEYAGNNPNPPCTTCYLSYDYLGSVRLITDQNANVVARHEFLPFGEESTLGRSAPFGTNDSVSQRFTGQARDSETGLDFLQARYYGAALGRFTSPDPAQAGADLYNPQSWNGYSYVANSPLVYTDPSGRCFFCELFGFLLAPETGGASLALTVIGAAVDTGILLDKTLSHGGSGGKGGSSSASAPPVNNSPLPPGSFPGGETAGLPPGMSLPGPLSPQVLLGLKLGDCEFGPCGFAESDTTTNSANVNGSVYLACTSVHTGVAWQDTVASILGFQHCWIKTSTKTAGLGPAANGPLPSNPFGVPVAITDQSDHVAQTTKQIPNVNEACVNAQLQIGKSCGTWGPFNNCNTFANGALARCKTNTWHPYWSAYGGLH